MGDDAQTPDLPARVKERARQYFQDLPATRALDYASKQFDKASDTVGNAVTRGYNAAKNIILPDQEMPTDKSRRKINTDIELPKERKKAR